MYQTQQIQFNKTPELSALCHKAKNLYNFGNWIIRTLIEEVDSDGHKIWIRFQNLRNLIIDEPVYKDLPAAIAGECIKKLDENWKSFFAAIKDYGKHPEKYKAQPKPPRFLKKNGEYPVFINYTAFSVWGDGYISFVKDVIPKMKMSLPVLNALQNSLQSSKKDERRGSLQMVRILPREQHYIFEFCYEKSEQDLKLDQSRVLGIDLGVNNLCTCVNNCGLDPFIINGKIPKSVNQFYNKQRAKLSSLKDLQGYKFETKQLKVITWKRNNQIKDYFHKATRQIIDFCMNNNIGTIVIGYNSGWKVESDMGKRTNQNFVQLPYLKLKEMIEYKGKMIGMQILETEESHTSKCSFVDQESIEHHNKYLGKRLKRGLFSTEQGILVNADVNGAYNIILKVIPNAFSNGIGDARLHPCSVINRT